MQWTEPVTEDMLRRKQVLYSIDMQWTQPVTEDMLDDSTYVLPHVVKFWQEVNKCC